MPTSSPIQASAVPLGGSDEYLHRIGRCKARQVRERAVNLSASESSRELEERGGRKRVPSSVSPIVQISSFSFWVVRLVQKAFAPVDKYTHARARAHTFLSLSH